MALPWNDRLWYPVVRRPWLYRCLLVALVALGIVWAFVAPGLISVFVGGFACGLLIELLTRARHRYLRWIALMMRIHEAAVRARSQMKSGSGESV